MADSTDIEKVTADPRTQVLIALPKGKALVCWIMGEFAFTGSNTWNNAFESEFMRSMNEKLSLIKGVAGSTLANLGVDLTKFPSLQTVEQSLNTWSGSNRPSFPLNVVFFAKKESDDVRTKVLQLAEAVFPTVGGRIKATDTQGATLLSPPFGYCPDLTTGLAKQGTTVTLTIGKWFRADGLLVEQANFTFSKEVIASGRPLYATVQLVFKPYKAVTIEDVRGYFI